MTDIDEMRAQSGRFVREDGSTTNLGDALRKPGSCPVINGTTAASVNEVQTITVDADGGTFTVTLGANTTAALAWNINAADMQTALEGLASIGAGNVTVGLVGSVYTCTFAGAKAATNMATMTTNVASLTKGAGAGTAVVATPTPGTGPGTVTTVTFAADANAVTLSCPAYTDEAKAVANTKGCQFSCDGGTSWMLFWPGRSYDVPAILTGVQVKSASAEAPYEIFGAGV